MLPDPQTAAALEQSVNEILQESHLNHLTEKQQTEEEIIELAEHGLNRMEIIYTLNLDDTPENYELMKIGWIKGIVTVKKALFLNASLGDNDAIEIYMKNMFTASL